MTYKDKLVEHYKNTWLIEPIAKVWRDGPMEQLSPSFCILEFPPSKRRKMWTYATCCMADQESDSSVELHLFSEKKNDDHVELLTAIAHYHIDTGFSLNLWHTVNFGRPWLKDSKCDYGLVSLPYLDGPDLEVFSFEERVIKLYWLIPITEGERDFKKKYGVDALEDKFEKNNFNYLDPDRKSVV